MDTDQKLELLLDGYQRHVATAAKTWIALATLSIYAVAAAYTPHTGPTANEPGISLPFLQDVRLDPVWFVLISMGLLAALVTKWVEALCRAVRTRRDLVEPLLCSEEDLEDWRKDLWDARVTLNTSTVWSAPAVFLGFERKKARVLALPHLVILKVLATTVHYGLPALAVVLLGLRARTVISGGAWMAVVIGLGGVALLQLVFGLVSETSYTVKAIRRMVALTRRCKNV